MNCRKISILITLFVWLTIPVILFMWSIELHTAKAGPLFKPAVNYGAGDLPNSVAIGDLDGDGNLDLAVANYDSDNVSILVNPGGVAKLLYNPVTPLSYR